MVTQKTNQTITTIHQQLEELNHQINVVIHTLVHAEDSHEKGHDRELLRRIREENIQTLQLIDKMIYTGEATYTEPSQHGGEEQ